MTSIRENADRASAFASGKIREASARVRESAGHARERTSSVIEENPLAALAGGLALGALVAALLPRSNREGEYLGSIGDRLRDASRDHLGALGINREAAREKVSALIDSAVETIRPHN